MNYPTDFPSNAVLDIYNFLNGTDKDTKKFVHGVYELLGYGLFVFYGNPNSRLVLQQVSELAMNPKMSPLVMQLIQMLLTAFLQKILTQNNVPGSPGPPFTFPAGVAMVPK